MNKKVRIKVKEQETVGFYCRRKTKEDKNTNKAREI